MRGIAGKSITLNPLVVDSRSILLTTALSLLVRTVTPLTRPTRINSTRTTITSSSSTIVPRLIYPHRLHLPNPVSEADTEQLWVASFLLLGNDAGWRRR
ncbi:hypothetical protein BJ165DRAFT_1503443 [Panaeolus papilionaceus]|nr:hypothetical protein BJ165DRAFT_1503443 [Panaeolus papilionaceus]